MLRAYLRRWKAEVGVFFDGTSADSSDDELAAIAPRHPVFVLEPAHDTRTRRPTDTAPTRASGSATDGPRPDDGTDTEPGAGA